MDSRKLYPKRKTIVKRTAFVFFLCVGCMGFILQPAGAFFNYRDSGFRERMIGQAFKRLANTYISSYDLEKGKKIALANVESMSEAQFGAVYARLWPLLRDLPPAIKEQYGLVPMSKGRMILILKTIQKEDLHTIVNCIPDSAIEEEFENSVVRFGFQNDSNDLLEEFREIQQCWQKVLDKVQMTGPEVPAQAYQTPLKGEETFFSKVKNFFKFQSE